MNSKFMRYCVTVFPLVFSGWFWGKMPYIDNILQRAWLGTAGLISFMIGFYFYKKFVLEVQDG